MLHPVTHKDGPMKGRADRRYSIASEYCGHPEARYVLRFCDEFVSQHLHKHAAIMAAIGHDCARRGALIIEGQPA